MVITVDVRFLLPVFGAGNPMSDYFIMPWDSMPRKRKGLRLKLNMYSPSRIEKNGLAGFTLVELLVVIAIMALVMAVAVPAFQGIGRDAAMRTAFFRLSTTIPLARQWAMNHRQDVYILFPDIGHQTNIAFRSYAVYAAEEGYLRDWQVLPPGIVFDPDFDAAGRNIFDLNAPSVQVPFPDNNSPVSPQPMPRLRFRAMGNIGDNVDPLIAFREGFLDDDYDVVIPDVSSYTVWFRVNRHTGQIRRFERGD